MQTRSADAIALVGGGAVGEKEGLHAASFEVLRGATHTLACPTGYRASRR